MTQVSQLPRHFSEGPIQNPLIVSCRSSTGISRQETRHPKLRLFDQRLGSFFQRASAIMSSYARLLILFPHLAITNVPDFTGAVASSGRQTTASSTLDAQSRNRVLRRFAWLVCPSLQRHGGDTSQALAPKGWLVAAIVCRLVVVFEDGESRYVHSHICLFLAAAWNSSETVLTKCLADGGTGTPPVRMVS